MTNALSGGSPYCTGGGRCFLLTQPVHPGLSPLLDCGLRLGPWEPLQQLLGDVGEMPGEETVIPTRINLLSARCLSAPPSGGLRVFHAHHASPIPGKRL